MDIFIETIKSRIFTGEYPVGSRLKSERFYANEFNLPQSRIHRALQSLVVGGYLASRVGSGYVVCERKGFKQGDSINALYIFPETIYQPGVEVLKKMAEQRRIHLELKYFGVYGAGFEDMLDRAIKDDTYDGIIVQPNVFTQWNNALSKAYELHYPLIFRESSLMPYSFPLVAPDHFGSGFLAARTLARYGYRKPAVFGFDANVSYSPRTRQRGFALAAEQHGLQPEFYLFDMTEPTNIMNIWSALEKLLADGSHDCIYTSSGTFTNLISNFMTRNGIRPPQEIGLLGVNYTIARAEQAFRASCLVDDFEVYIDKTFELLRSVAGKRTFAEASSILISPHFVEGDTLVMQTGNRPAVNSRGYLKV